VPNDELLRLLGTAGDPRQTLTTTGSGSARYAEPQRAYRAVLRIGGTVVGTTPTLDMRVQASADGLSGWTTLGTFAQRNAPTTGANISTPGVPNYAVPTTVDPQPSLLLETGATPYLRADYTIGGTAGPSFGAVSVELYPQAGYGGNRRSGV